MILFIFFASPPPPQTATSQKRSLKSQKKRALRIELPSKRRRRKNDPSKAKKKSTSHRTALQMATSQKRSLKSPKKKSTSHLKCSLNTEDRNRTDTRSPSPDFESGASTSSATPAQNAFRNKEHFAFEVLFEYRGSESNRYEVALARF